MTEQLPPIEIAHDSLSAEVLTNVIESFILQEGTDYGAVESSLETKIRQVRAQVEKGDVKIVFDPNTDSVTLLTKTEFAKRAIPSGPSH